MGIRQLIEPNEVIAGLTANRAVFKAILAGLSRKQYMYKPDGKSWCILEVVCHLHDEEVGDFRERVGHVLHQNPGDPPSINPPAWVTERKYIEQDFAERKERFLFERAKSISWLESLEDPDWDLDYRHPKLGPMSARLFLHNWLAHDYHHIRQINRLKYEFLRDAGKVPLDYAGNW